VQVETGPIYWGEPGTNGQHSFYQLIHQGTSVIPCDLIAFRRSLNPTPAEVGTQHDLLVANAIAQAAVLAFGRSADEVRADGTAEDLVPHKEMEGNRPSTFLMLEEMTPFALGSLVSLYEHIVFTQSVIWGINAFDQWGVELGKVLAVRIAPLLTSDAVDADLDASTLALVKAYKG
jgi:glucose-6-phosphate isomerase